MAKRMSAGLSDLGKAIALDTAGQERLAVPMYRRALSIGLSGDDLHAALVGLGSLAAHDRRNAGCYQNSATSPATLSAGRYHHLVSGSGTLRRRTDQVGDPPTG